MRLDSAINIEDLHQMAKRRLPKVAFDFIEGGLEDEHGLDRNTAAFRKHNLLPRYLVDVSKRERNMRNGFANIRGNWLSAALRLRPSLLAEAMTHPGWIAEYIRHGGTPALGNWLPYLPNGASAEETVKFNRSQVPAHAQTWKDLERYRRLYGSSHLVLYRPEPVGPARRAVNVARLAEGWAKARLR